MKISEKNETKMKRLAFCFSENEKRNEEKSFVLRKQCVNKLYGRTVAATTDL